MSANQFQHYLPKSYQKGWATNGLVHVYEWRFNKLVCRAKSTTSTGGRPGLYYVPMAPPEGRNYMEDHFWRKVDQDGADGLHLLRSSQVPPSKDQLGRLAVFVNSLGFRNPVNIAEINDQAKRDACEGCLADDYETHRRDHEPTTFEEFRAQLDLPGLSELGAQYLREATVVNPNIIEQLLLMDWQVVTVTNSEPILTSDRPLIRHKGLRDDDGMWLLPLSSTEFLAIYNHGKIDMKAWINESILAGTFIPGINRYVVRNKIEFVYGRDASQLDFVAQHWGIADAPSLR